MVKHINGLDGRRAVLFAAEYQVDPLMKMLRHVVALQRESVHANELARILLRPWWKNNIAELNAALLGACTKPYHVLRSRDAREGRQYQSNTADTESQRSPKSK